MTLPLQPPEKSKQPPSNKPGGDTKQVPAKIAEKSAPSKEVQGKTGQEAPSGKETAPPAEAKPVEIPAQPPPGALIAVPPKEQPKNFEIGSILQPALLLIGILALGAILIAWLKKNRDRTTGTMTLSAHDQLSAFRDSLDEGDMTDEEFKKVKAHLTEKIRKPANAVTPAPGPSVPVTSKEDQPK